MGRFVLMLNVMAPFFWSSERMGPIAGPRLRQTDGHAAHGFLHGR